jgi:RNA polymerase sigma-70 factor (ECF subfamily)
VDEPTEPQWINQARAGDRQAFAKLVNLYWPRIYRWLYGLTRNTHLAEDQTQDVFLKAWSALGSFEGTSGFRAWLYRIAGNALIDSKRGPRSVVPQQLPDTLTTHEPGPVMTVLGKESQTVVHEACGRLPLKFRSAFLLRTQEELSFAEIAQALEITEETVRWRVFKARQMLLDELKPYLDGKIT